MNKLNRNDMITVITHCVEPPQFDYCGWCLGNIQGFEYELIDGYAKCDLCLGKLEEPGETKCKR